MFDIVKHKTIFLTIALVAVLASVASLIFR